MLESEGLTCKYPTGAISDAYNSLRTGMQVTWIAVLVSGFFWFLGWKLTLSPQFMTSNTQEQTYFRHLLCVPESFVVVDGNVMRSSTRTSHTDADRAATNPPIGPSQQRHSQVMKSSYQMKILGGAILIIISAFSHNIQQS